MCLFTDNEVAEQTYFRGLSHSSRLHEIIMESQKMETNRKLIIQFTWILGKRMLAKDKDRVFKVDLSSGVMAGKRFLKYLPLNKTTLERQEGLKGNFLLWVVKGWKVTTTENWFDKVFVSLNTGWTWCPPSALAKWAVGQLYLV